MARILDDDLPPGRNTRKYPWEEWTDGKAREIRQGDDYYVTNETMRMGLFSRANRTGTKVRTQMVKEDGEWVGIRFQFYRNGDA